jgi:hypothetical protein
MASGKLLRQLIKSGIDGKDDSFRQVSEAIIIEERQKQHHLLVNDLERILYGRAKSATPGMRKLVEDIPTDRDASWLEVTKQLDRVIARLKKR